MECSGIKDLLSEYIDDVLDSQTKAEIDQHLFTCEACSGDLASMKALVEKLRSLAPVKAPDDFLEKLHERMEPRMSFKKAMRILFIPGRIKIPLELATAAVVGILIFSLINIQQSQKMMSSIQESSSDVEISEDNSMHMAETKKIKRAYKYESDLEETRAPELAKKREVIQLALLLKKDRAYITYHPKEDTAGLGYSGKAEKRARIARQAVPGDETKAETLEKEDMFAERVTEESPQLKGKPVSPTSGLSETLSEVKNRIHLMDGKVISIEYDNQTGHPKSLHAEIPAKNYLSFIDKLKNIATFQIPPPTLPTRSTERIEIHISFMPL
ncbi:MAG: zf-HC2 domain-containing protein [Thermodesulfobacteriota bacterium]|nr:zf-HC2 domain-containing protein [Thermodesulfobacteriota bacterium]